jgi:hypothetical protein
VRDADETGLDAGLMVARVLAGTPDVLATDAGPMSMAHLVPASVRKDLQGVPLSGVSKAVQGDARRPALYGGAALAAGGGLATLEGGRLSRDALGQHRATLTRAYQAPRLARVRQGEQKATSRTARGVNTRAASSNQRVIDALTDASGRWGSSGSLPVEYPELATRKKVVVPHKPSAEEVARVRAETEARERHKVSLNTERARIGVRDRVADENVRIADDFRRRAPGESRALQAPRLVRARRLRVGGRAALATGTVLAGGALVAPSRKRD